MRDTTNKANERIKLPDTTKESADQYAIAASAVLNDCVSKYSELGKIADSHVIDATTLLKKAAAASGISKRQLDVAEGTADPQGSASFAGADIEIYNESAHHVLVDGKVYEPGEKIATVTTDGNGLWISAKDWSCPMEP